MRQNSKKKDNKIKKQNEQINRKIISLVKNIKLENNNSNDFLDQLINLANQGYKNAQYELGLIYLKTGKIKEGHKFLTKSSKQGHKLARKELFKFTKENISNNINNFFINDFGSDPTINIALIEIQKCDFNTVDYICEEIYYPFKSNIKDDLVIYEEKINVFKKNSKRFILQFISIEEELAFHSNVLIYDKKYNIIEIFDPAKKSTLNIHNFNIILELYLGKNNVTIYNIINNSVPISEEFNNLLNNNTILNPYWKFLYKKYINNVLLDIEPIEESPYFNIDFLKVQFNEPIYEWKESFSDGYCTIWCILYAYVRTVLYSNYNINYTVLDIDNIILKQIINNENKNELIFKYKYIQIINNIYYHFIKNIIKKDFILYYNYDNIILLKKYAHYYYTYLNTLIHNYKINNQSILSACSKFNNLDYQGPCYNLPSSFHNLFINSFFHFPFNSSINPPVNNINKIIDQEPVNEQIESWHYLNDPIWITDLINLNTEIIKTMDLPMSYIPLKFQELINKILYEHIPNFANKSFDYNLLNKSINKSINKNQNQNKNYILLKDIFNNLVEEYHLQNKKLKTSYHKKIKTSQNKKKLKKDFNYTYLNKNV